MFKNRMRKITRTAAFLLGVLLTLTVFAPFAAFAKESGKVVRVGWHEEPYFITDRYGRRSGYSYDYQCKVAAYIPQGSWEE